jgi:hypothetical protein
MNQDIIIKPGLAQRLLPALLLTAFLFFMGFNISDELFDWKRFNPHGINTIIFLILLLMALFCWLLPFDSSPSYKISVHGIYVRKKFLTKSFDHFTKWSEIEYYFIETNTNGKGVTRNTLMIKLTTREKYFKMTSFELGEQWNSVVAYINQKATEHNFHDLGTETNYGSRY